MRSLGNVWLCDQSRVVVDLSRPRRRGWRGIWRGGDHSLRSIRELLRGGMLRCLRVCVGHLGEGGRHLDCQHGHLGRRARRRKTWMCLPGGEGGCGFGER